MFKNLVGSKTLTREDLQPALEKMRDHLIGRHPLTSPNIFKRFYTNECTGYLKICIKVFLKEFK